MATEIGVAYLSVVPSMDGAKKELEKQLGAAETEVSRKGKFGSKIWGGLKAGAVGAGVAVGGILAGSITKGFQRLSAIEDAEAKLVGLGNSAEDVEKIMSNALGAVKGTAFGMGEAATTAASAVAAGIKPGQELESYLSLVGDAASIAGTDMATMGSIFNKVATSGKVQGDVFAQLGDAGIPVVQLLADELGVTAEEVYKMGAAGEIGSDDFLSAMSSMEGAALEMGGTTSGAWRNLGAAMGRFGATLLEDVYPYVGPLLGKITDLFDYLTDQAGPAIDTVVEKLTPFVNGLKGVWDLLTTGDFTGAENMFGFEEDSGFVDFLFGVRDAAIDLWENALLPLGTFIKDNILPILAGLGAGALWAGITAVAGAISAAIAAAGGLSAVIGAAVGAIAWVPLAIGAAIAALVWFFRETETGQKIFQGLVSFVTEKLWPGIVGAFEAVRDFVVNEFWPMLKSRFEAIRDLAVQVWEGVIQPAFEQFAGYIRDTVMPIVERLWTEYVQPAFVAIGGAAVWMWENAIKPAMSALDDFIGNVLGPVLVWLWENVVSPVFTAIGDFIGWAWEKVIFPALDALKYFLAEILPPALQWLWETAKTVWSGIQDTVETVVSWFQTWVWPVISLVLELTKEGFRILRDVLKGVWNFIRDNVISPVVNWFRDTAWPIISRAIDLIKDGFTTMRDTLKKAWNYVKDTVIEPVANWFRDTIEPLFKRATDSTGDAFTGMKDTIKKAWDNVKEAAKSPIRFVVETVINDALIGNFNKLAEKLGTKKLPTVSLPRGFARGGVLPGFSRMRDGDDQLVPMRRGEGVIVSEALRSNADKAAFLAANAAGRRGVGFSSWLTGGFAGGGILGDLWRGAKGLAGDALDKVLEGVDFVAEALKDPSSIFTKVYDAVVGEMPAAGLIGDAARGASKKLLSSVIDTVKDAITPAAPEFTGAKGGGSLSLAQQIASGYGLTMTSHWRRGARTAGSGSVSLHAQGRAMDFSNSSGPTPQMMAFFNAMHPYKPTELLYSPAGARQWRRGGYMADTSGATKSGHYNHVHVGFAGGGVFDQGGMLQPGMVGVNLTKRPEAVLDPQQTAWLKSVASSPNRGEQSIQIVMQPPNSDDPGTWARRAADTLGLIDAAAAATW